MKIALDYDGTYTEDPELWNFFKVMAERMGHEVWIVTMRRPEERIEGIDQVIYTSRKAKKIYCDENNLGFTIWIDDTPEWLFTNG